MLNSESSPATAVRLRLTLAVPLLAGALALGACTGGGSDGPSTAAPSTGASSSSTAPTPTSTPTPSPSTPASSQIAHANPLVYTVVTSKQAKTIEQVAARAPGVQSVSYDNEHQTISLYLKKSITKKQRTIANRVVIQVLQPAG